MSFKVKALYEYSSGHEDDLKFGVGQIITITDEEDADWYGGEYTDESGAKHEGIFPRNFVEKYEPTAPPRPARSRPKKEAEPTSPSTEEHANIGAVSVATGGSHAPESPLAQEELAFRPSLPSSAAAPLAPAIPAPAFAPAAETASPTQLTPSSIPEASTPSSLPAAGAGRKPSFSQAKPSPPPVADKPSSFRDRIAAFNKPAAPPVAPFKPSGLATGGSAGFIKKPFVAPPPSRDSYVPPQREAPVARVYRRDEDPAIKEMEAEALEIAEKAGLLPGKIAEGNEEKPASLKDRIALLQKQQIEASKRQAELAAKKEKPKKPPIGKRSMSSDRGDGATIPEETPPLPQAETADPEPASRRSGDEPRPLSSHHQHRRKLSKSVQSDAGGDAIEGEAATVGEAEPLTDVAENDESDGGPRPAKTETAPVDNEDELGDQDEGSDDEEEEPEIDPEIRRKEELRARMAKMSGGMGMPGMFGMVPMAAPAPPRKKKSIASVTSATSSDPVEGELPLRAPPVPTMIMALPGMSTRQSEDMSREEQAPLTPAPAPPPSQAAPRPVSRDMAPVDDEAWRKSPEASTRKSMDAPPPVPGGRPAPPPMPVELTARSPLPPPAELVSQRSGSESDDELSERALDSLVESSHSEMPPRIRSPPPPIPQSPGFAAGLRSPLPATPASTSHEDYMSPPTSPHGGRRNSRPPPPIPGSAPALPSSSTSSSRPAPPPPPPPPIPGDISRQSTADVRLASPIRGISRSQPPINNEEEDEVTEYEGDYDTDIASSVPHKEALKSHHNRDSSIDDATALSPSSEDYPTMPPPPPPSTTAPRAAPSPAPFQSAPETGQRSSDARRSLDAPRMAPSQPPPAKEEDEQQHESLGYTPRMAAGQGFGLASKIDEEETSDVNAQGQAAAAPPMSPTQPRGPYGPTSFVSAPGASRAGRRQSLDVQKGVPAINRRSQDMARSSMDSGFIAEDVDLAMHVGWWKQPNQVPPVLQNRRDVYHESSESTTTNGGTKTTVCRETRVLFLDYSQTTITVKFDPYDQQDVDASQYHEPPPRALRQDQLEQAYERYGMHIAEAVAGKKDTIVGDGTPLGLIHELLRPWKDVLAPVGTRAFGALVYANLANASTHQNDEIRKGDILTIRNARFQGKHGPMHAKYSMEVGRPDHVAVVAEWDGTKKKVRAWEQGRESKKVKLESFKLDDLRSGEVKVWRVMPRSWVGWTVQP